MKTFFRKFFAIFVIFSIIFSSNSSVFALEIFAQNTKNIDTPINIFENFSPESLSPASASGMISNFLQKKNYKDGEVIVHFKKSYVDLGSMMQQNMVETRTELAGLEVKEIFPEQNISLVATKPSSLASAGLTNALDGVDDTQKLIEYYKKNPNVEYVQPNYRYVSHSLDFATGSTQTGIIMKANAMPTNDPYFDQQWYLKNTGQKINGAAEFYEARTSWLATDTIGDFTKEYENAKLGSPGVSGVDIGYETAFAIYENARARLSAAEKAIPFLLGVIGTGIDNTYPDYLE